MAESQTVHQLLDAGVDGDPAIVTPDGSILDRRSLRAEVARLGQQLTSIGIGPGDRIAIVLPNGPEMAITFLAAATTGCAAPLNPKYREDEFRFYLDDLGAKVLVSLETGAETARSAAGSSTRALTLKGTPGNLALDVPDAVPKTPTVAPAPSDIGLVLHTSGTTSRPKIVPIAQSNLARSATNIALGLGLTAADRSLNVMPLFHIHGLLAGLLAPLSAGASVVCTEGFDAFAFFRQLESFQPTYYTAVPTMHQMVLARAERHRQAARNSSLRFIRSSSASLPVPVLDELDDLFGVPVIEAYGMTEATHQMAANPLPPGITKPGSVGLAAGIELAVLDNANRQLGAGERGEVSIKGPTVIGGYENNPEANAAAFTAGWFRTGDEGYLDEDGYLYLTGRLKEQINRGGEKISPLEVDEALLRHDSVAQAVTFAIPHDKLGEEVGAGVVLHDGATATEREIRQFVSETLASFKVPRTILFLDELPKGATGKLQRIGLAERLGLTSRR
ncbi:MAG: acyl--CoA ligase [Acidimicrobiia bacterium]|nr:acyl--CoA ligase [Acidimicrobiia bacterium]